MKIAVDNLCVYDPEFLGYGDAFTGNFGDDCAAATVSSMNDLIAVFDRYALVKYLEIALHGTPGMIYFANKGAMAGSHLGTLAANANLIKKDVRVLFASCNIGEGIQGDEFMAKLAKNMLVGKGGTIGASTVANVIAFPTFSFAKGPFLKPFSGGILKVRRYDITGSQIGERKINAYRNYQ